MDNETNSLPVQDDNEMVDVNLNQTGNKLPPKSEKIAMIDADTIAFASAVTLEYFEEVLPKHMYTDEEWAEIALDPGFDESTMILFQINMDEAVAHSIDKIETILMNSGCTDFELHFTAGRKSFRYDVDPEYKANRLIDADGNKSRGPFGLYELKKALVEKYNTKAQIWHSCEADDVVWWYGDMYPEKYLVCAVDKDVLGATKALAFNYYTSVKYQIDMKFKVAEDPENFWYKQCLMGDKGDGIIGIDGIGPAKAKKILLGAMSDTERWERIVNAYERAGRTAIEALMNMRMVRLDQFNPETCELVLWDPRNLDKEV